MVKWDYKVKLITTNSTAHVLELELQEIGREGWELVSCQEQEVTFPEGDGGTVFLAVFKRPMEEARGEMAA